MTVHILNWNDPLPQACRKAVVSIGNFDGVHCGHQRLLERVRLRAAERGVPAVALTFNPHPLSILRPSAFQPLLTTPALRSRLLLRHGAEHVVVLRTTQDLLALTAAEFFERILIGGFAASGLVEGPNFGFGRDREGDVGTLARFCAAAGMFLEVVQPLEMDGAIVSSSRVRGALLAGDVAAARRWLGRPYRLSGTVVMGQQRGRSLGFPTANLSGLGVLVPADGVYAGSGWVADRPFPAAIHIGPNPTFGENVHKVEVHLLNFAGELYGQEMAADFLARLRDTRSFSGPEELRRQLATDAKSALEIFAKQPPEEPPHA